MMKVSTLAPRSWRDVAFRDHSIRRVNRFERIEKKIRPDFDHKRLWLDDWEDFSEVRYRNVESLPLVQTSGGAVPLSVQLD